MVEINSKDLFKTKCDLIAHQVNCKGVMNSGIAKSIRNKFPEVYKTYKYECLTNNSKSLFGNIDIVKMTKTNSDIKYVANLYSQYEYGNDKNKIYTSYEAFENCIKKLFIFTSMNKLSVAFPYGIGCGKGNGDWEIIYEIINKYYNKFTYKCEICKKE